MLGDAHIKAIIPFLDAWLGFRSQQQLVPGISVAIGDAEQTWYQRAWGAADLQTAEQLTPEHVMYIGSQSKVMTAILILRAIERGQMDLHAPASTYLPWLRYHQDHHFHHISIEQLLQHSAGIVKDGSPADFWQLAAPFPGPEQVRRLILSSRAITDSQASVKYSNVGYALLGLALEAAAQKTYQQLAEQDIIQRLDLQHTSVGHSYQLLARGYAGLIPSDRQALPASIHTHSYQAATGWCSTPAELVALWRAIYSDPQLLSPASKRMLLRGTDQHWQPARASRGRFGLGTMHATLLGHSSGGHSGSFIGYRSCTYTDESLGTTVSVMVNSNDGPATEIAAGILSVLSRIAACEQANNPTAAPLPMCIHNLTAIKYLLPLPDGGVLALPLGTWAPLELSDQLQANAPTTFTITKSHYLAALGEMVKIVSDKAQRPVTVTYAGQTYSCMSDPAKLGRTQKSE